MTIDEMAQYLWREVVNFYLAKESGIEAANEAAGKAVDAFMAKFKNADGMKLHTCTPSK